MEEDGSLTFEVLKRRTPANIHTLFINAEGTQIDAGEKEIIVYGKIICTLLTTM